MGSLFELTLPPWELILRGSAVYWFLFIIFRFVMHRDVGSIGIADVLLLVLVADASQNAMAGEYKSITDGFILVATIIGWNYLLDWAAYRFPAVAKLAEPPPLLLVRRGRVLKGSLRQEMLTEDDLMSKLREHGVDDVAQVKKAYIEGDGSVTVIRFGQAATDPAAAKKEKPV
jgi:uncharacterized membrane protein YcaP (DUF421 family)